MYEIFSEFDYNETFLKICELAEAGNEEALIKLKNDGIDLREKNTEEGQTPADYLAEKCCPKAVRLLMKLDAGSNFAEARVAGYGYLGEGEIPPENISITDIIRENPEKVDAYANVGMVNYDNKEWFFIPSKRPADAFCGEMYRLISGVHHPKTLAAYSEGTEDHFYVVKLSRDDKQYAARMSESIPQFRSLDEITKQEDYDMTQTAFIQKQGVSALVSIFILNESDLDPSNLGTNAEGLLVKIDPENSLGSKRYIKNSEVIRELPSLSFMDNGYLIKNNPLRAWFGDQTGLPENKRLANISDNPDFQKELFKYLLKFILLDINYFDTLYKQHCGDLMDYEGVVNKVKFAHQTITKALVEMPEFKTFIEENAISVSQDLMKEYAQYNVSAKKPINLMGISLSFSALLGKVAPTFDQPLTFDIEVPEVTGLQNNALISNKSKKMIDFQSQLNDSLNQIRDKFWHKIENEEPFTEREEQIWSLVFNIKDEVSILFAKPITDQSFETFQYNINNLIDRQQEVLETHEGWKEFSLNVLQIVSVIGIFIGALQYLTKGSFFIKTSTDSEAKFNLLSEQIDSFSLQA